jgi:hypothetical protein
MRPLTISLIALTLTSTTVSAQLNGLSVGGGVGVTASSRVSGMAYHGAASMPIAFMPSGVELRLEGMYQGGTVSGSPFACERVRQLYCLGRTDENRIAAAAFFVRARAQPLGVWRFYFDPIGVGVYHRRTTSTESQGPTGICIIDDTLQSCPNNPDWATFSYRVSRTSLGANIGGGVEAEVARIRLFLEARTHVLFERGRSIAGAVPLTFGVSF